MHMCKMCAHAHTLQTLIHPSVHSIITAWCAAKPQIKTENEKKMEKVSQKLLFVQILRESLIDLYK